jgi:hypothetical protein
MTQDDIIDALQRQKQQLEEQMAVLLPRCQTDAESAALKGSYSRALQQWNEAVNTVLRADDPLMAGFVSDLNSLQDEINDMIAKADDLGAVLSKVATGIGIGAKILALVK